MRIYRRNMTQTLTVFRRTGMNAYGEPSFDSGTTIRCRWQDAQKLTLDAQGEEFVSESIIYPAVKINNGDRIVKGAGALADAKEVRSSQESPSLDGRMVIYKAVI